MGHKMMVDKGEAAYTRLAGFDTANNEGAGTRNYQLPHTTCKKRFQATTYGGVGG